MGWWLLPGGAALALIVVLYNRLVRDRNRVDGAWSDIEVQLQRRHDLVPQLVEAVDQYARYERATLEAVTELRSAALVAEDPGRLGEAEEELERGITRLLALAERYPELQANRSFLELQKELVATENYLQFARRYYNGAVREYNTRVASVPHNLLAATFGFRERQYFQKTADEAAAVPLARFGTLE